MEAPPAAPPVADEPEHRGHVRIVDDEVAFASSLARVQGGERYDVIRCDRMMPEMTGSDLYATLTELAPDQAQRILFITGGAFSPTSQLFLERAPNTCFEKPGDIQKLRSAIRQQIASVQS